VKIHHLIHPSDIQQAQSFLAKFDLAFELPYDNLVACMKQGNIVGLGARHGCILKMFAVDPEYQTGEVFPELVTTLVQTGIDTGLDNFFVFTKPEFSQSFQSLNFKRLYCGSHVVLLEYGKGINQYLHHLSDKKNPGDNGCIVVNCNPFTLGHRYLIEQALQQCDHLYIIVVEEDRSSFPFPVRLELILKGVSDIDRISVIPSGPYAVSQITFPNYFLKDQNLASNQQIEIDLHLFGNFVAPFFDVRRRFVGNEPYCQTTAYYNHHMKQQLSRYRIDLIEIPRCSTLDHKIISASTVRRMLRENQQNDLEQFLPSTTLEFVNSSAFNRDWLITNENERL